MKLSVVIPAHNEESCIGECVRALVAELSSARISHEIIVVLDHCSDGTRDILGALKPKMLSLSTIENDAARGFGLAVRRGLDYASGDAVAVYMADGSDSPCDLVRFYRVMTELDVDCVFGSRFSPGGSAVDYPRLKLIFNRAANAFIRILFGSDYNDTTNAFKLYRKHVIEGAKPLSSRDFNLTVELPLKAITRGYTYAVVPNSWHNRQSGKSKLKIMAMCGRYLFTVLDCLIERQSKPRGLNRRTGGSRSAEKPVGR